MIKSIRLLNFRNYKDIQIKFSKNVNIFVGNNGQGKSNILEALTILSTGESFRYSKNESLIKFNEVNSKIFSQFFSKELDYEVQVDILKSKKNITINKKKCSQFDLFNKFPIVLFSPESLSSIKEGADLRRQLIDDLIISINPKNAILISEFKKTLKTRNKILKNYLDQVTNKKETLDLLESIFPSYFSISMQVTQERIKGIHQIQSNFKKIMNDISNSDVDISVEYVVSGEEMIRKSQKSIHDIFISRFKELENAELASGASLVGPHKHDIQFLFNGKDSRYYCSQGQQRAMILSFKMAQIVYHKQTHGIFPILLLDDVLSELDSQKRDSLIQFLGTLNTQIFITTTDFQLPGNMKSEDCAVLNIRDGTIESNPT